MVSLPTREQRNLRFGLVSLDILTDILSNLNKRNKSNLENVSDLCGCLKERRIVGECWSQTSSLDSDTN